MAYQNCVLTVDTTHGLGLLFNKDQEADTYECFYEDGTLATVPAQNRMYNCFEEVERYSSYRFSTRQEEQEAALLIKTGTLSFFPASKEDLTVKLSAQGKSYELRYFRNPTTFYSYYLDNTCSCKNNTCIHRVAVARMVIQRERELVHAYVNSSLPVNKGIFLDPELYDLFTRFEQNGANEQVVKDVQDMVQLLRDVNDTDYYWQFHYAVLDVGPFYEYDSHYLENQYNYLLMALFDDPGYKKAVLDTGEYAEPEYNEGRQYRSNRACLKRLLKSYNTILKELGRGDYSTWDDNKEFLLKYRGDMAGLLRLYASEQTEIAPSDLPFIDKIAELPDADEDLILAVARKIDPLFQHKGAYDTFHRLVDMLPGEKKVDLYSTVRNIPLSMDEILRLPHEDQLRLVASAPLNAKNVAYLFDNLLKEESDEVKADYLLATMSRPGMRQSPDIKAVIETRAKTLPHGRLFLSYIQNELYWNQRPTPFLVPEKEEEVRKELSYFAKKYEIVNEKTSYHVLFKLYDPHANQDVLVARENKDGLTFVTHQCTVTAVTPQMVREICIDGKEKEYQKACEKEQEAVDTFCFAQQNQSFASAYNKFCSSLKEEKVIFTEEAKAHIEWFLYREAGKNALAFKVGNTKMYVVKDAPEFMNGFKTGQTVSYGKDLLFTHDLANLESDDAQAVKLIMASKLTKGRPSDKNNKRYLTVNDTLLGSLLDTLAGRTVYYNDAPCCLRLDNTQVRLGIDSGYIFYAALDASKQSFMNLTGKGYLLTKGEKEGDLSYMDHVEGSPEAIALIELAVENPSVKVKPIIEDFKKQIYARFFEMFDVDSKVQKDFTLSPVKLNTYFDLEKNTITVQEEIWKEENVVEKSQLTERMDLMKVELLENYLSSIGFVDGEMVDESKVLSFFKMDFTRLKSLANVYLSETLQRKEIRSIGRPTIRVSYQNNLASVFLEQTSFNEAELEKILAGLRKKKKYIFLEGDRIIDLSSEAAQDFAETVKDLGMDPKHLYEEKRISMVSAIKAFSHEKSCHVDKYLREMITEIRSFKEADLSVPTVSAQLREYQTEGYKWLSILSKYGMGGILADDMGLGKTLQMITLLKADEKLSPSLVVCPKSLVFNWANEFARFDPQAKVSTIYGAEPLRAEKIEGINYAEKTVYITSYDSLRNDIGKYTGEFNYVILDEAQYIKNVHALKTKSVKELKASHRFALTGTPIENSVVDLWSIFDFIMPGYFEELSKFKDSDTAVIARKAGPFILRRVKEDVLDDLPPKYERILSAEMSPGQRKQYEAIRMEARQRLEEGGKAFDMLPYLTKLRQACVDPRLNKEDYKGGSGKMDMLSTLIPEYLEQHHRILVFSQFVKALRLVQEMLDEKGIPTYFLYGDTPGKERIEMMDSFNNGSGTDVFLISLKAGGTGLNLTGADTVIHLDPWWNVAAEEQASDRTHRIGQTRNVEVIKLIADDSVEQRVVELQEIKKEIIQQVISDDDGSVTNANLEDIAFVLE